MTLDESTQLVTTAGVMYPATWSRFDAATQRATFAAWAAMLEDVAIVDGLAALKRHAATSKFFPSVAEIRAIVAEAKHGRRRSGMDAWGDVRRAVGSTGRYRTPTFTDPLVARAVAAIGWAAICDSDESGVTRAHFARAYDALAEGAAEDRSVAALPGVARPAALPGDVQALVERFALRLFRGEP